MPFVTEELWQTLVPGGASILVQPFPESDASLIDAGAEERMELLQEIIVKVRNVRGEMGIPPSRKLRVLLCCPDAELAARCERGRADLVNLANLEALAVEGMQEAPKGAATAVVGSLRIYVPLQGVVDLQDEQLRLAKELAKVEKELAVVEAKLANPEFRARAAAAVIAKEEGKERTLKEKREILRAARERISSLESAT
jgi:valyl-tRNA synthetase